MAGIPPGPPDGFNDSTSSATAARSFTTRLSTTISQHPLAVPPTISTKHSVLGASAIYVPISPANNRFPSERSSDDEREAKKPRLEQQDRPKSDASCFSRPIPRNTSQMSLSSSISGTSTTDNCDDYADNWSSSRPKSQNIDPVFIPRRVHSLNDLASLRSLHTLSAVAAIASISSNTCTPFIKSETAPSNPVPINNSNIIVGTGNNSNTNNNNVIKNNNANNITNSTISNHQSPVRASFGPLLTSSITHIPPTASSSHQGIDLANLDLLAKAAEAVVSHKPATATTTESSMKHSKSMSCLKLAIWDANDTTSNTLPTTPTPEKDKEKKAGQTRRDKPVRPKVVESKGTLQCLGTNRKKKMRCRNAALMEYIGPRPQFCAEHIALDVNAQYHKCDFRGPEDSKGCKEIVYKDFSRCYKHFKQWLLDDYKGDDALTRLQALHIRVLELLAQLEQEASVAKHEDSELYQRKSKLIPKYQSMDNTLKIHIAELKSQIKSSTATLHHIYPSAAASTTPTLSIGVALHQNMLVSPSQISQLHHLQQQQHHIVASAQLPLAHQSHNTAPPTTNSNTAVLGHSPQGTATNSSSPFSSASSANISTSTPPSASVTSSASPLAAPPSSWQKN
eukprot:c10532_g1_i1.p1 GENE.c10532_g1_i1~~c10532_g1_i1.p1  ORF type:complete len:623 (-),score=144.31 c10532_g1_i1:276-2144(-)